MSLAVGDDTYIDLATADAYFAGRLHGAAWIAASNTDREKALRMATSLLDGLDYKGERSSSFQPLAWPRRYVIDNERRGVAADLIPPSIQSATAEWAMHLLAHDPAQSSPIVTRKQVGDLQVDFAPATPDLLPIMVRRNVSPYLCGSANTAQIIP